MPSSFKYLHFYSISGHSLRRVVIHVSNDLHCWSFTVGAWSILIKPLIFIIYLITPDRNWSPQKKKSKNDNWVLIFTLFSIIVCTIQWFKYLHSFHYTKRRLCRNTVRHLTHVLPRDTKHGHVMQLNTPISCYLPTMKYQKYKRNLNLSKTNTL